MNHGKMRTGVVTCQTGVVTCQTGVVTCQTGVVTCQTVCGHMSNGVWSHVKRVVTCQKNAETYMLCLFVSRVSGPPFRVRSLLRSHRRLHPLPCWSLLRSHSFWREVVERAGRYTHQCSILSSRYTQGAR